MPRQTWQIALTEAMCAPWTADSTNALAGADHPDAGAPMPAAQHHSEGWRPNVVAACWATSSGNQWTCINQPQCLGSQSIQPQVAMRMRTQGRLCVRCGALAFDDPVVGRGGATERVCRPCGLMSMSRAGIADAAQRCPTGNVYRWLMGEYTCQTLHCIMCSDQPPAVALARDITGQMDRDGVQNDAQGAVNADEDTKAADGAWSTFGLND